MATPKKKTVVKKKPAAKKAVPGVGRPAAKKKSPAKLAKSSSKAAPKKNVPKVTKAPAKAPVKRPKLAPAADPARSLAIDLARLVADSHCDDVLVLDVSQHSSIARYLVIGSGTSDRQVRAVARHVAAEAEKAGFPTYNLEEDEKGTWVALDLVDILVHLFEPGTRAHYDLETLWPEAERLDWAR